MADYVTYSRYRNNGHSMLLLLLFLAVIGSVEGFCCKRTSQFCVLMHIVVLHMQDTSDAEAVALLAAKQLMAGEDAAAASAAAKKAKKKNRQTRKQQVAKGMTKIQDASSHKENMYTEGVNQSDKLSSSCNAEEKCLPQEAQADQLSLEAKIAVSSNNSSHAEKGEVLASTSAEAAASTTLDSQDAAPVQSLFCCPITKVSLCSMIFCAAVSLCHELPPCVPQVIKPRMVPKLG